jgi:glycosyltransferase involved in cell wall biosynthesis
MLRIVGTGPETPRLQSLIDARDLRSSVEWVGGVAPRAVGGLMADAAAVLVPSRYEEPFGLVAVEAGLMCRPVIAAAAGGLQEIVVHERTGYLVPMESPAACTAHMIRLLADPAAAAAMGRAGRARALSRYSLRAVADRHESIYSAAVKSGIRRSGEGQASGHTGPG